jgi:chemotaxis protein CheD
MKPSVNIHIGEYYSSRTPVIITTILGPCAAVCLFDPVTKIGGMNHILLPGDGPAGLNTSDSRYGINAMELLINQMMDLGADRYRLKAKIFGGASVMSTISAGFSMGMKNIEFVVNFLITENIPITNYNFGGVDSRRIYYHTDTGDVLLKRIKSKEIMKEYSNIRDIRLNVEKKIKHTSPVIYFD